MAIDKANTKEWLSARVAEREAEFQRQGRGLDAAMAAKVHKDAPVELSEFIVHLKSTGVHTYKGDFVTTTGEHIPVELTFERAKPQRSSDG